MAGYVGDMLGGRTLGGATRSLSFFKPFDNDLHSVGGRFGAVFFAPIILLIDAVENIFLTAWNLGCAVFCGVDDAFTETLTCFGDIFACAIAAILSPVFNLADLVVGIFVPSDGMSNAQSSCDLARHDPNPGLVHYLAAPQY